MSNPETRQLYPKLEVPNQSNIKDEYFIQLKKIRMSTLIMVGRSNSFFRMANFSTPPTLHYN